MSEILMPELWRVVPQEQSASKRTLARKAFLKFIVLLVLSPQRYEFSDKAKHFQKAKWPTLTIPFAAAVATHSTMLSKPNFPLMRSL